MRSDLQVKMDLKVWVDGVQRVVCGVTEFTTCQEVVFALAQAIGRTGRYTLIERWRDTERHLAPSENPVMSLNKWGQFAGDVQLILLRSGPSASERPASGGILGRGLFRQSLPPPAKLRPPAAECSLKRRDPKRKSFAGRARSLREIFVKSKNTDGFKQPCIIHPEPGRTSSGPGGPASELGRLVQLQSDKLQVLQKLLLGFEDMLPDEDKLLEVLEQQMKMNNAEIREEEFWQNQLQLEQENEQQLMLQREQLWRRLLDCEQKLSEHLAHIQKLEEEVKQESRQGVLEEHQEPDPNSVGAQLEFQNQQAAHLEVSLSSLQDGLGRSSCLLQEKEQELELLTKELRRVNLQQFIQKSDSRVTPHTNVDSGSLDRLSMSGLTDPSVLKSSLPRDPAGVYV